MVFKSTYHIGIVFHPSAWIGLKQCMDIPFGLDNEKYIMVGSYVEEPEIKEPGSGAIYLWLIDNNSDVEGKILDRYCSTCN